MSTVIDFMRKLIVNIIIKFSQFHVNKDSVAIISIQNGGSEGDVEVF